MPRKRGHEGRATVSPTPPAGQGVSRVAGAKYDSLTTNASVVAISQYVAVHERYAARKRALPRDQTGGWLLLDQPHRAILSR